MMSTNDSRPNDISLFHGNGLLYEPGEEAVGEHKDKENRACSLVKEIADGERRAGGRESAINLSCFP